MTSCSVTDQNNNTISNALSSAGTAATVNQATTYTLSCTDGTNNYSSSVTVRIVPVYQELSEPKHDPISARINPLPRCRATATTDPASPLNQATKPSPTFQNP